uniref:Secreted protein n=1 Tax=Ixodes ricinus TaxID=34613 RepID=A0A6B0UY61_IXORI
MPLVLKVLIHFLWVFASPGSFHCGRNELFFTFPLPFRLGWCSMVLLWRLLELLVTVLRAEAGIAHVGVLVVVGVVGAARGGHVGQQLGRGHGAQPQGRHGGHRAHGRRRHRDAATAPTTHAARRRLRRHRRLAQVGTLPQVVAQLPISQKPSLQQFLFSWVQTMDVVHCL